MKHFFINKLDENSIQDAKERYGKGYTNGHQCEHALQVHFNNSYIFDKDNRKFTEYSDIENLKASVKSANATIFVATKQNGCQGIIDEFTPVAEAVDYYITNDVSTTYFVVLDNKKWIKKATNQYTVLELDKNEMKNLLNEMACTDRDSRLKNGKNCLRLKRTDDVLVHWYMMNK